MQAHNILESFLKWDLISFSEELCGGGERKISAMTILIWEWQGSAAERHLKSLLTVPIPRISKGS
jgi:hypothetical protein